MAIFQRSVLQKHFSYLNKDKVARAFLQFRANYSSEKIEKIKMLKEEEYQDGFLRDIFVDVLGFTLKPDDNFNLVREFKNQTNSQKADGAILDNDKVLAVIELKSTSTKDLTVATQQAFNYKNNQPGCKYVITSNFHYIRLYIDNATEYEEFNLFDLPVERFRVFYLLLSQESIINHLPEKLKQETRYHEEQITEKLYKDYRAFKDRIFDFLVSGNPQYDKLTLFKKSQKLLDRFLFVLFAEDSGLIPPNAISKIIEQWKILVENDEQVSLYSRFQKFFTHLDKGHVYKQWGEIPAYNGGLFLYDEILDSPELKLPDGLLLNHTAKLSAYDFGSEVDVNILGHIFEHSLSEIEELTAELQGETPDKTKSKRKKDGIFYTPKYITKYIVYSTVGLLCNEKKTELCINELLIDNTYYQKNGKLNQKGKDLFANLQTYKNWLISLKILDPACGSGAFLNQTLDFLISEHQLIDNIINELTGESIRYFDLDKQILENNIFGVDINEESIEIARLSLWLRTAQRGRPLSDLSGNIKQGNSLIDDPKYAGELAFNWQKEFPKVFGEYNGEEVFVVGHQEEKVDYLKLLKEKAKEAQIKAEKAIELSNEVLELTKQLNEYSEKINAAKEPDTLYDISVKGFDVILGNPPYVRLETMKVTSAALSKMKYETFEKRGDLYVLFVERGFSLLKPRGVISYIMPNKWIQAGYGKALRNFMLKYELRQLIDFGDIQIFDGATTYPCIFVARKAVPASEISISVLKKIDINEFEKNVSATTQNFRHDSFSGETWVISSNNEQILLEKLKKKHKSLAEFVGGNAFYGIKTGLTDAFLVNTDIKEKLIIEDSASIELLKPFLLGRDIVKYVIPGIKNYLLLIPKGVTKQFSPMLSEDDAWLSFSKKFKSISTWLSDFKAKGINRTDKGDYWWELRACDYYNEFAKPKIMYQTFQVKPCFIFDDQGLYCNNSMWIIPTENKALLAILNSKMGWWLITKYCTQIQNGYQLIWKYFGQIPIADTNLELASLAEQMLTLNKRLQTEKQNFIDTLKEEKHLQSISNAIEHFNELDFEGLKKEIGKQKARFSLGQETNQWRDYFNTSKQKADDLQNQINQTDKEIDRLVYELYELTFEEIEMVESIVK